MKEKFSCGVRLRQLRRERNMSQEDLALTAGVTTVYISEIERGLKNPTVLMIETLSNAMNLSLSEFFACSNDKNDSHKKEDAYLLKIVRMLELKTEEEKKAYLQLLTQVDKIQQMR